MERKNDFLYKIIYIIEVLEMHSEHKIDQVFDVAVNTENVNLYTGYKTKTTSGKLLKTS